jgi:hypothetical protein
MKIPGAILISYPIEPKDVEAVVQRLGASMVKKEVEEARAYPWDSYDSQWIEREPKKRLGEFEALLGGWSNPDQEPIFRETVRGYSATLQAGDLLPFKLLTVEFRIMLETEGRVPNRPQHLIFLTQHCRDFADKIITGLHGGEILTVTSQTVSRADLDRLFESIEQLRVDPKTLPIPGFTSPLLLAPPVGESHSRDGFSHLRIAYNLHAVLAPLTSSLLHGPGWVIHFYEEPGLGPDPEAGKWGTRALNLVDPTVTGFTRFVEQRVNGLPLVFATWSWLKTQRHEMRNARKDMMAYEAALRKSMLHPKALASWRMLASWDNRARARTHQLRTVRDEYEADVSSFIQGLAVREAWVAPPGLKLPQQQGPSAGHLQRLLEGFLRELKQTLGLAETTWDMAKAQKESYKVRAELFLGIAVLLLAILQAIDSYDELRWFFGWLGEIFGGSA